MSIHFSMYICIYTCIILLLSNYPISLTWFFCVFCIFFLPLPPFFPFLFFPFFKYGWTVIERISNFACNETSFTYIISRKEGFYNRVNRNFISRLRWFDNMIPQCIKAVKKIIISISGITSNAVWEITDIKSKEIGNKRTMTRKNQIKNFELLIFFISTLGKNNLNLIEELEWYRFFNYPVKF